MNKRTLVLLVTLTGTVGAAVPVAVSSSRPVAFGTCAPLPSPPFAPNKQLCVPAPTPQSLPAAGEGTGP
jgi:hypothetical protein